MYTERLNECLILPAFYVLTGAFKEGKTFQNLKVSSPAPVTIVWKRI